MTTIDVVAALIADERGRALMVRKAGTLAFMQPGGKARAGETAVAALCRELREELGLELSAADFTELGIYESEAANEPGYRVRARAFWCDARVAEFQVGAEIAEARWLDPDAPQVPVAPLTAEHFFDVIRSRAREMRAAP